MDDLLGLNKQYQLTAIITSNEVGFEEIARRIIPARHTLDQNVIQQICMVNWTSSHNVKQEHACDS